MSRESCISHKPSTIMAIVKEDYCFLMGGDAVSAALLNLFEYWANAAIAQNPDDRSPNIGCHSISEFQRMLVGISTDKQIRARLKLLEEKGFIEIKANKFSGKSSSYRFFIDRVQEELNNLGQMTSVKQPRYAVNLGQTTNPTSVKQPTEPRSNDRSSIYMNLKNEEERRGEPEEATPPFAEVRNPEPQSEEIEPKEIRPPVNETEKIGEKDSTSKGGSKNRSSAAAPAVRPPSELERFKALYNERRPKAWGAMQQVTAVRKGKWKTLVAEMGSVEKALEALGNALDYCCSDPWWSTKNLTFDNMATNGKIVQLHEKQLSKVSTAQAMPAAYHPPAPAFEYRPVSIEETRAAIAAAKAAVGAKYANSN
jgi:hypothetical protein